jgi:hypothetical protein
MAFSLLADATVVLHLIFVAFVMLGGLLLLRYPKVVWLHVPAAAWGAWVEVAGWYCPLTPLENWLRERAGESAYSSSFVEHYVVPVLYPAALTREIQWSLGAVVILVNAGLYLAVFVVRRHRKP